MRASEVQSKISRSQYEDVTKSVINPPFQVTMRIGFCCKIAKAPLLIVIICMIMDFLRALLFTILLFIPGQLTIHFLANVSISLLSFLILGQALLIKNQLVTSKVATIYAFLRV